MTYFMVVGIVLGLLLFLAIALKSSGKNRSLRFLGWFLFVQTIVAIDVFLCYSGLMKYTLYFNDSTEPLVLMIAPLIYLFVYELLFRNPLPLRKYWIHFLPGIVYATTQIGYYLHPLSVKMNAYVDAYFPNLPMIAVPEGTKYPYQFIKDEFRWLILGSFVFYIILSLRSFIKYRRSRKQLSASKGINKYFFSKNTIITMILIFLVVLIIFLNYEDDGGDHIIAIMQSLIVLFTTFLFFLESRFFENSWIADKYETLRVREGVIPLGEVENYVISENYFLENTASLKGLASVLNVNPNYLSKTINSNTGMNFNDFINRYRVEEAKKRLVSGKYSHLTVAAIGATVGFTSKSAFYTAFRKHAQESPTDYIKRHQAS
ncbi:MAG: helix-turn-helix domain-containing protein [Eudoraea sp.]|nr:helix-turn-helix domain-containing protein [Eudoraea sp.]